jgi:hypothetical protein
MRSAVSVSFVGGALLLVGFAGCAVEPEQMLVGKWGGDTSAATIAIKAAKMKADNPDISAEQARDYARAAASFAVQFKSDKTCDLYAGGNVLHGTYTFDKEENLAEIDFKTADVAPENKAQNPEPFQPQQWIAMLDPEEEKLEVSLGDRNTYKTLKEIRKTQKLPGLIVLRKQS